MSTHKVEIVRLGKPEKHPNADTLEIFHVWGFTCLSRIGSFKEGDLAAYLYPDCIAPSDAPWADFLGEKRRIKAKRLRGVWSQGLLIPAPPGASEGDNVMDQLGITHYDPPEQFGTGGQAERPCDSLAHVPKYDIENLRRYASLFVEGEEIYATEKIHGTNSRYAWREDRMWCGSRTLWKRQSDQDLWWQALKQNPWIEDWCKAHPDCVLYGEVFGQVQDLKYDSKAGELKFRAFDILKGNQWFDAVDFHKEMSNSAAPILFHGPFNMEKLEEVAMGDSVLAKHLAEGIVIKPARERTSLEIGRVALKLVSNRYLDR